MRVSPGVSSTQRELAMDFNKIMRNGNGFTKAIIYILPFKQKGKHCLNHLEHAIWLRLDVCTMCVRFAAEPRPNWLNDKSG